MLHRTQWGLKFKWELQDNVTQGTKGIEVKWELQDNVTEDTRGI